MRRSERLFHITDNQTPQTEQRREVEVEGGEDGIRGEDRKGGQERRSEGKYRNEVKYD